jgi:hypothetical protein
MHGEAAMAPNSELSSRKAVNDVRDDAPLLKADPSPAQKAPVLLHIAPSTSEPATSWWPATQDAISKVPELAFAIDVFKKIIVFLAIALSAFGIHALVAFMERQGAPPSVTLPLRLVEYLVIIVDVLWVTRVLTAEVFESYEPLLSKSPRAKIALGVGLLLLALAAILFLEHPAHSDLGERAAPIASAPPPNQNHRNYGAKLRSN